MYIILFKKIINLSFYSLPPSPYEEPHTKLQLLIPTCRWNSNSRSALSSIIALRKAGSGRTPPGMDSKSVIRWAILALILRITCTCTWEGERWGLVIHCMASCICTPFLIHCMASCICTQFFDTLYGFMYMHMRGRKEEKGFYERKACIWLHVYVHHDVLCILFSLSLS